MSDDKYDVLPLSYSIGIQKDDLPIKPIVPIYFPTSLLEKVGWTKEDRLVLSVEKGFLKIEKAGSDVEPFFYDIKELTFEPIDYD